MSTSSTPFPHEYWADRVLEFAQVIREQGFSTAQELMAPIGRELYAPDMVLVSQRFGEFQRSLGYSRATRGEDYHIHRQRALENLVSAIYEGCLVFDAVEPLGTSVSQIDHYIRLNAYAQTVPSLMAAYDDGGFVLSECKNLRGKVDVTWLGKFASLCRQVHPTRLGIIVSGGGLTGRNGWDDARGLQRIVYMRASLAIVSLAMPELQLLADGHCLYDIIAAQIASLHAATTGVYERFVASRATSVPAGGR